MTIESHKLPQWLQQHSDGNCLTLTPNADTLNEPEGRQLSEYLRHRLDPASGDSGTSHVVLDLTKVTLITSPAIGALIVIHKRMATSDKQLLLNNLAPMLVETLCFLKLDKVLTICQTPAELSQAMGR